MAAAEVSDLAPVREILARFAGQRGALITVLQAVQAAYGYLPEGALQEVAVGLGIIMIGAARAHARLHEPKNVATNLVLLALCLFVAIGRLA